MDDEPQKILVAALRNREDSAYEQLLAQFGPRLLATARRICGNESDAQDVLQDACVACFRSIDAFKAESSVYTWMHRIVVTNCLMRLRKKRRRNEASIESLLPAYYDDGHRVGGVSPEWAESSSQIAERQEIQQVVRECILQLPESYRNILMLRDIEELDTSQTAELLDVNEGVVKTRLHRARQALRTLLEPYMAVMEVEAR